MINTATAPIEKYNVVALKIIKAQQNVVGPLAIDLAQHISGLTVKDPDSVEVDSSEPMVVLDNLVKQYEKLFGLVSVEVSKEAVKNIISGMPSSEIPDILKD